MIATCEFSVDQIYARRGKKTTLRGEYFFRYSGEQFLCDQVFDSQDSQVRVNANIVHMDSSFRERDLPNTFDYFRFALVPNRTRVLAEQ
jgi:hypothetical protein